ncbi:MAG: MotA/TolQ/ExbB proton channel family protein [Gammaproteobacteria bacterium]|nr:MotA/TolQ/ExbB proton channel family protein [Gammaproteobacteria bacterium]
MKRTLAVEFFFQILALILAVIVIHSVYATVVRPNAEAIILSQHARIAAGEDFIAERSLYVVLKDYEQETCFILFFWAMAIMGFKSVGAHKERALLQEELIPVTEGMSILPEDSRNYTRPLQALPEESQGFLLPRALTAALQRFGSTRNVQDVSEAVKSICESENARLDSELSMIRYIAWAIPSIGFIGTVRGIGAALGQAHQAVQGNIAPVTESLGVAFNSTFVALVLSIILMFFMHQVQLLQERLVLDTHTYADARLIRHMQVRS